jgi:hypothetical protein
MGEVIRRRTAAGLWTISVGEHSFIARRLIDESWPDPALWALTRGPYEIAHAHTLTECGAVAIEIAAALDEGWRLEMIDRVVDGMLFQLPALCRREVMIFEGCMHAWVASPLGLRASRLSELTNGRKT